MWRVARFILGGMVSNFLTILLMQQDEAGIWVLGNTRGAFGAANVSEYWCVGQVVR